MNRIEIIKDAAPMAGRILTELGHELVAGAERLFQQGHAIGPVADNASRALGPVQRLITPSSGETVAFFQNNKAAALFKDGSIKLFDRSELPTNAPPRKRFVLYDGNAAGKEQLESVLDLRSDPWDEHHFLDLKQPEAVTNALKRTGADQAFLQKAIPEGSIPIGLGSYRTAFLTRTGEASLLGPPDFRAPVPEMLFPTRREINHDIQFERLSLTSASHVTIDDAYEVNENIQKSAWNLRDFQRVNVGRLPDQTLKVVDNGAVSRLTGPVLIDFDHANAAERYRVALNGVVAQFGAESHPAGGLHAELGRHYVAMGERQSAEHHLLTGLNILENHQDWLRVTEASDWLSAFHRQWRQNRLAKTFTARSATAREHYLQWEKEAMPVDRE